MKESILLHQKRNNKIIFGMYHHYAIKYELFK